jgi:hypothetical protein
MKLDIVPAFEYACDQRNKGMAAAAGDSRVAYVCMHNALHSWQLLFADPDQSWGPHLATCKYRAAPET